MRRPRSDCAAVIERERQMPQALRAGAPNLRNPPRDLHAHRDRAAARARSTSSSTICRTHSPAVRERALQAQFRRSNARGRSPRSGTTTAGSMHECCRARTATSAWAPRLSAPSCATTRWWTCRSISCSRSARADLKRNQQAFARVAHELEPGPQRARRCWPSWTATIRRRQQLLTSFRATFDGLVAFIREHHIITHPGRPGADARTDAAVRARDHLRLHGYARDRSRPVATTGLFQRHPAGAGLGRAHASRASWPQFNYPVISNTAVHEAYPGHYVQFLWDAPHRMIACAAVWRGIQFEGWAHYCEQMMLDEGFGQPGAGADPRAATPRDELRLGQLQDALLRDARYIVGIRMHTGSMTLRAGDRFLRHDQGYQSREVAETESKRGTSDPTYLYYTLGKLQILKLRADLRRARARASASAISTTTSCARDCRRSSWCGARCCSDDSPTL